MSHHQSSTTLQAQPASTEMRDRLLLAAGGLAVVVLTFAFLNGFRNTLIDDAFIQLTYARNLIEDGVWGMMPGRISNTATSPLNVLATAVAGLFIRDWLSAVIWLTTLELAATFALLIALSRRLFGSASMAAVAFVGLLANPLFLSTLGMEVALYALLLVAALAAFAARRWTWLAIALAGLTLTRPEGVLLAAILLVVMPIPARQRLRPALTYILVMAPWYLYSWIILGSVFPDTMIIKTGQGSWGPGMSFPTGLSMYLDRYPLATMASFWLLPLAVFAFWRASRPVKTVTAVLLIYGSLHFLGYTALGVPPYHWYYLHQMIVAVLVGALGAANLARQAARRETAVALLALFILLPAAGVAAILVRDGFPAAEAPIHTNWATHDAYREVGRWLDGNLEAGTTVMMASEIGTLAFYAPRQNLMNEFSDLNVIEAVVANSRYMQLPGLSQALAVNYLWRRSLPQLHPEYVMQHDLLLNIDPSDPTLVKTWPVATRWSPPDQTFVMVLREVRR